MSEAATIEAILANCRDRGIMLSAAGEKPCVDAPKGALTPDLLDALRHHKPDLLDILRRDEGAPESTPWEVEFRTEALSAIATDVHATPWEECIEPPDPCPTCGGLMFWWDMLGGHHCMDCHPSRCPDEEAEQLRQLADRLRQAGKGRNSCQELR